MNLKQNLVFIFLFILLINCGGDKLSEVETFSFDQPTEEELNKTAPEYFQVKFETSKGDFILEARREWSPLGVDRVYHMVRSGYLKDIRFFRVLDGFMAQFGAHGDPAIAQAWRGFNFLDDPVIESNQRGFVSFATGGPNTRTTQLFINYGNNAGLDGQGFSPLGKVIEGMEVVDALYSGYGEGAPQGPGPNQGLIAQQGNEYLKKSFPKLDYIKDATIIKIGE
jgi:peptidyl-prolyl cis-trans isomerase A (cyclophilin A)